MALNHAATVTLCWRRKASHSRLMLLLVSGTTDHEMILNHARRLTRATSPQILLAWIAARLRPCLTARPKQSLAKL
jgi:hypothetical protein